MLLVKLKAALFCKGKPVICNYVSAPYLSIAYERGHTVSDRYLNLVNSNNMAIKLKSTPRDRLLRQQELADYIGVTVQTVIAWEKEGLRPEYRRGTFVLYDPVKVNRWLYAERVEKRTMPNKWLRQGACNGPK